MMDVQEIMKKWDVPGVAIGIVRDGKVIYSQGFGYKDVNNLSPVTSRTVMPIGSATKSFTAVVLCYLENKGILSLDEPIKTYIPDLKLYNSLLTENVTLRDCLCHRTGLSRHDVHGMYCIKDRKSMVSNLEYLEPKYPFRSRLQYSNQMVMLAGYVAQVCTGKSWEELVQEIILNPLEMKHTYLDIQSMKKDSDYSIGYNDGCQESGYLTLEGLAPAGSINSCVEDMNKYLLFQLSDGMGILPKKYMNQMHKVQMFGSPYSWRMEELSECNYGLCWFVDVYRNHKMIDHGGNTLGFSALMTLLPEQNVGIIVLSNRTSTYVVNDVTYRIIDQILGLKELDWTQKMKGCLKQKKETISYVPISNCEYNGIYVHPAFGKIHIENGKGNLNGFEFQFEKDCIHMKMFETNIPIQFNDDGIVVCIEDGLKPIIFYKES